MKTITLFSKALFILFFCSISLVSYAQDAVKPFSVGIFKYSPLVLFEPDGGVQFGYERMIGERASIQLDGAWLGYSVLTETFKTDEDRQSGFAIKPELRFYSRQATTTAEGLYWGIQGLYKRMKHDNVGMINYIVNKEVYKLNFKFGYQHIADCGLTIDIFTGIGIRHGILSTPTPDIGNKRLDTGSNDLGLGSTLPNLALGLKLGWAL